MEIKEKIIKIGEKLIEDYENDTLAVMAGMEDIKVNAIREFIDLIEVIE
jgi:hypothetical protein